MGNKEGSRNKITEKTQGIIMGYEYKSGSRSYSLIVELKGPIKKEKFELDVENHNSEAFKIINRCVIECVCKKINVEFKIGEGLNGDENKYGSGTIKKISELIKEDYEREYEEIKKIYKIEYENKEKSKKGAENNNQKEK